MIVSTEVQRGLEVRFQCDFVVVGAVGGSLLASTLENKVAKSFWRSSGTSRCAWVYSVPPEGSLAGLWFFARDVSMS